MTMSTNTKVNAELELRPLADHELETVNGGWNMFGSSLIDFAVGVAGGVVGAEAVAAGYYAADAKLPSMFQVFRH